MDLKQQQQSSSEGNDKQPIIESNDQQNIPANGVLLRSDVSILDKKSSLSEQEDLALQQPEIAMNNQIEEDDFFASENEIPASVSAPKNAFNHSSSQLSSQVLFQEPEKQHEPQELLSLKHQSSSQSALSASDASGAARNYSEQPALYYEQGSIYFARPLQSALFSQKPFDFSQPQQSIINFLSNEFNETLLIENNSHSANSNESKLRDDTLGLTLMNQKRTRLVKAISITYKDEANRNININTIHLINSSQQISTSIVCIHVLQIIESLQGQSSELLKYIDVTSFRAYHCASNPSKLVFAIEINLGYCNLYNVLRAKKEAKFDAKTMKTLFQGILAMVLQIHSRGQAIGYLALHSVFILPETFLIIDYYNNFTMKDNIIHQMDKDSTEIQQKQDLYELGKLFLAIEFVNEGLEFEAIRLACSEDSPALAKLANKHNCNRHILKTNKFIEIDSQGVLIFEVENIVEAMLSRAESLTSLKIAMLSQKQSLFHSSIVALSSYDSLVLAAPSANSASFSSQSQSLVQSRFNNLKETQDQSSGVTTIRNSDQTLFEGFLAGQERKPNGKCSIRLFKEYTLTSNFTAGEPYGETTLSKNQTILEENKPIFNYIFKQWLNAPKVIQSVTIEGMLKIERRESRELDGQIKLRKVCRDNIIVSSDSGQEVIRLSAGYWVDEDMFSKVMSMVGNPILLNMNTLSSSVSIEIPSLSNVRYFSMKVDSELKAQFVVNYLSSEVCSALETLDLSHSTKLEYSDYKINAAINASKYFNAIHTIVLTNCLSFAPQHFVNLLLNSQQFKKIHSLYLDFSCVDPTIFSKFYDSPNVYNLRTLSLNEAQGLSDASFVQFAEKMPKFKGLRVLNLRGLLKKSFNKSLFSDSNISAMKKVAGQMHFLTILSVLVLDDCYVNDSVIEILAKISLPCLLKISLRKQQKLTQKGLTLLLQSNSLPCLQTINCNACLSLTLPKAPFVSSVDITLSLFNCKSIIPSALSDYLRGNSRATGIRFDAKLISNDVIASINASRSLRTLEIFCADTIDILKFFELLRTLDRSNSRKSPLERISFCLHMSRSFIDVYEEEDQLELRTFKLNQPAKPEDQQNNMIDLFYSHLNSSIESNTVKDTILDRLHVHRQHYKEFLAKKESTHKADQSSFFSAPSMSKQSQLVQQRQSNSNNQNAPQPNNNEEFLGFTIQDRQKVLQQVLPHTKKESQQKPKDDEEVVQLNQNNNQSFEQLSIRVSKMQFIQDLREFAGSKELASTAVSLDLSRFNLGSDEISILAFSENLHKLRILNLSRSMIRSADLATLALKSKSLSGLKVLDLSATSMPIFPGFMQLLHSEHIPQLSEIKLSSDKLKFLLKHVTSHYRRVTLPLTLISNFSKFKTDNKIKISVENSSGFKKYLPSLDFYLNKKNRRSVIQDEEKKFSGEIKAMLNEFTIFYFKKHHRHANQLSTLLRLMRFQRLQDERQAQLKEGRDQLSQSDSAESSSNDDGKKKTVKLTVIGHSFSGKKTLVETFLESNFLSPDHLRTAAVAGQQQSSNNEISAAQVTDKKQFVPPRKLEDSLNFGIKSYHTELYRDAFADSSAADSIFSAQSLNNSAGQIGILGAATPNGQNSDSNSSKSARKKRQVELEIRVLHSHEAFSLLRLCSMRDSDGIVIVYDASRDDEEVVYDTVSAFNAAQLFRSSKPVFVGINRILNASSKAFSKVQAPSYFVEKMLNLSEPTTIRNFFEELTYIAIDMKKRKSTLDSNWLTELADVMSLCELNESELMLDFMRVRNDIDFATISEFCEHLTSQIESLSRFQLTINNWGNHGQSTEDVLNKTGNTKKMFVRITDSLQSTKNYS